MIKQLTEEEAIKYAESGIWKNWSAEEIVKFQLFQRRLCMPFIIFHRAIEKVLGRPVWVHEFANRKLLIEEYLRLRNKPTMEEIIELIPKNKRIIILTEEASDDQS